MNAVVVRVQITLSQEAWHLFQYQVGSSTMVAVPPDQNP
jgi:hypothetical protein